MCRIKERIPAIIENCRLKMMRTPPSSDDETIFKPPFVLPGLSIGDGEAGSSKQQARNQGGPSPFCSSNSNFEIVPTSELISSKAQGKRRQHSVRGTNDMGAEAQQEIEPCGSSTDFSIFDQDILGEVNISWGENETQNMVEGFSCFPDDFFTEAIRPITEGSSAVSTII